LIENFTKVVSELHYDKLNEECAVFGVSVNTNEAAGIAYNGLMALQHRGQEAAGIAVLSDNLILYHKNMGLVSEVFSGKVLEKLPKSNLAVGHTRYSASGFNTKKNIQPFVNDFLIGRTATVHNGNITNAKEIREKLKGHGLHFETESGSEVVSSLITYNTMKVENILEATINAVSTLEGAFSLIILSHENKLIAVRDPDGFRPLCLGENESGMIVASESCAVESCGFKFLRNVEPGEIVVIENGKIVSSHSFEKQGKKLGLCIFEYVYFARPDSVIDDLSVYEARLNMGRMLAKEHPIDADVVCGVPDSGLEAASGYALESGLPLVPGFMKNRYIGRSFIFPTQSQREDAVRIKLNPLSVSIKDKRVILVDDSIVRGTTSAKIIKTLKNAGAKEVHMRISSPPFKHVCNFGTDIDSAENLIANKMSIEEIGKHIGADSLGFISLDGLKKACENCSLPFCSVCFTGEN